MNGVLRRGLCWLFGGALFLTAAPVPSLLAQAAPPERVRPARTAAPSAGTREWKAKAKHDRSRRRERAARRAARHARASEAAARSRPPAREAAREAAAQAAQAAATEGTIVKEGDTRVKVMTFSGLDIEGRLRSPQLVYFTQRVRTEFERPTLPHRSFMPELADTTAREPLR